MKYSLFSGSHGFPSLGFSHRQDLGSELSCSAKHTLMQPDVALQMTKNLTTLAMGLCFGLFLNCEAQKGFVVSQKLLGELYEFV